MAGRKRIAARHSTGRAGADRSVRPSHFGPTGSIRRLAVPLTVFGIAALTRLAVAASLWDLPLVRTPKLDSAEYLAWAQRLASGDWTWPVVAQHGPGYPLVLAAWLTLASGSLKAVLVAQALLGACTAVLIASGATRWFGPRAGLLAGLAYALYGPAVYIDVAILAEGLLVFLLTLAVFALMAADLRVRPSRADTPVGPYVIAGVALGLATLTRPTALFIAAACAAWLIWNRRLRDAIVLAAAGLVVLAPAIVASWKTSRTISLQGYGGLNVYIGDSPLHDGRATFRLGAGWDALNAEAARAGVADPAAQDRYYLSKTWREIREHPGAFVRLLASKIVWLVQAEEPRDSHSYYFFTGQSPLLRVLPRWSVLFPLACVGIVVAGPRSRKTPLLFYLAGAAASVVFLVVGFRYRMPLVPALAIFAGVGLAAAIAAAADRRVRDLAIGAAVLLAALAVSHVRTDARNRDVAEEWAFTGSSLVTERRLGDAEAAYRRALELDSRSGLAWDGLALTLYNAGRLAEAKSAVERALAIDPESSRALFHRGLIDEREGRVADAAAAYERALQLSPHDGELTRQLADARRKIAVELGMSGRTNDARDMMRRVLDLTPANGDAWLDLCLLSLDLHDTAAAADALQRARNFGAEPNRLAFAADALARAR